MKKIKQNLIGVIGDLHFKDSLGFADHFEDRREGEKKEILTFITDMFEDCDSIVFLGDNLNARNNTSKVIKEFVTFVESFNGKEVYILAGNHEKTGNGKSAIDFLKEIKNPKWHIITNEITTIDDMVFCPYLTKPELETNDNLEALKNLMKKLPDGKILFHHYAVTKGKTVEGLGISLEHMSEPVLGEGHLMKKYKLVLGGHVHVPYGGDNIVGVGSVFNNEVNEIGKFIWKIDMDKLTTEQIRLPGRSIFKIEDPTDETLEKISKKSILKVIITNKLPILELKELKKKLEKFDAYTITEKVVNTKRKMEYKEGESILEMGLEDLLKIYAKERKIKPDILRRAYEIIK